MSNHNSNILQKVTWEDVRDDVKKINPSLANIIDDISPNKSYQLLKVRYNFGDLIVKNGILQIPNSNVAGFTSINKINELKDFSYSQIPLSLLLTKSSEVFLSEDSRIIPLNILNPGQFFGTFEFADYLFNYQGYSDWNVSAGARSIIVLPKISEALGLKRLRKVFNISPTSRLKYYADHWDIFKQIIKSSVFNEAWYSDVLIFSDKWFCTTDDTAFDKLKFYILGETWRRARIAIGQSSWNTLWQFFTKVVNERNLKPSLYLADTIKHLLLICSGLVPSFVSSYRTDHLAPIEELQKIILDVYLLQTYTPTILVQGLFKDYTSLYYSLSFPTLFAGSPSSKKDSTIMAELRAIKLLIDTLTMRLYEKDNHLLKNIALDFFHVENDPQNGIISSKELLSDQLFADEQQQYGGRIFCATSSYWRGCIKIAKVK